MKAKRLRKPISTRLLAMYVGVGALLIVLGAAGSGVLTLSDDVLVAVVITLGAAPIAYITGRSFRGASTYTAEYADPREEG